MGALRAGRATRTLRRTGAALRRYPLAFVVLSAAAAGACALRGVGAASAHHWTPLDDLAAGLAGFGALGVLGIPATIRRERIRRSGVEQIDGMSGRQFEEELARLYSSLGYEVRAVGGTGDFGADLVVERAGHRTVIQAKRYDGTVGIEAVQQVIGAQRYYGADAATVATNSAFTRAALALAAAHDVSLVERDGLIGLLASRPGSGRGRGGLRLLLAQVWAGTTLLVYAVGRSLRVLWWILRRCARIVIPPHR